MWSLSVEKHRQWLRVSEWASFPKGGLFLSEEISHGTSYDILQPAEPNSGRFPQKLQVPVSRPQFELETHTKCCLALSGFWYLKCSSPWPFLPTKWILTPLKNLFFQIPFMKTLDILFIMLLSWSHCNWLLIQSLSKTSLKEPPNLLGVESSLLWHKPGVTLFNVSFKEFLVRACNLKIPGMEINLDSS